MTSIITILILSLIECAFGYTSVDIFNFKIPPGSHVFHGRFNASGIYKMIIHEPNGIKVVKFGSDFLFPHFDIAEFEKNVEYHKLAIELFLEDNKRFVIIHIFTSNSDSSFTYQRFIFRINPLTYSSITIGQLLSHIQTDIFLSFDVSANNCHPFLKVTTQMLNGNEIKLYSISDSFYNVKFNGIEAPKYAIGSVYDSKIPAAICYSKIGVFAPSCVKIAIFNRNWQKIVQLDSGLRLEFSISKFLEAKYWFLTKKSTDPVHDIRIQSAIYAYDVIHNAPGVLPIVLDISENVDPDLYGIEKVKGWAGEWSYTLYKVKKKYQGFQTIKSVFETSVSVQKIYTPKENVEHVYVEVLKNNQKTMLFIFSYVKENISLKLEWEVFQKSSGDQEYTKLSEQESEIAINEFKQIYPIKIDVTVEEEPTSLYEKRELSDEEETFNYFSIKETNEFGEDNSQKYTLGNIYGLYKYEIGNIECEPYREKKSIIMENANNKEIIIKKYEIEDIRRERYEIYECIN